MRMPTVVNDKNYTMVDMRDGREYHFSYQTLVAFRRRRDGKLVVRQNDWSTTTGKHLNALDGGDKKSRVDGEMFERMYADEMKEYV